MKTSLCISYHLSSVSLNLLTWRQEKAVEEAEGHAGGQKICTYLHLISIHYVNPCSLMTTLYSYVYI